jgi:outer membrane protein
MDEEFAMNRKLVALAGAVLLTAAAGESRAVEFTLGAGAAFAPDYEGSNDYEFAPLWLVKAANLYHPETYVQILGTSLSSNFLPDDHFRLGLAGLYKFDYDNVDDRRVQDVKSTDSALLLGPTLGYDFWAGPQNDLALEVDAIYDVAHGNGGLVTPKLRIKSLLRPGLIGEAKVSTTWASDDYMGNWYSINAGDAASSGLPRYNASQGMKDVGVSGSLTYLFTPNWSLTGIAGYSRLLGDAEDSPIVADRGDENQWVGGLLVNYRF